MMSVYNWYISYNIYYIIYIYIYIYTNLPVTEFFSTLQLWESLQKRKARKHPKKVGSSLASSSSCRLPVSGGGWEVSVLSFPDVFWGEMIDIPSPKLTFSPLRMDGWKTFSFHFGGKQPYFQGRLLLVSGSVLVILMISSSNGLIAKQTACFFHPFQVIFSGPL